MNTSDTGQEQRPIYMLDQADLEAVTDGAGSDRAAADGKFDQDQSRLKYLAHLRSPERRSARSEPAAKHAEAKTQLLHIRIEEKQRQLVRRDPVDALIDQIAGTVLTHLSGMSARCSRDMVVRRNIDAVVMQIRREISEACSKMADECGEPPLVSLACSTS